MTRALSVGIVLAIVVPMAHPPEMVGPPDITGMILQVDREHARLVVLTFDVQENSIGCDEETVVTLDGYAATFSQLQVNFRVAIQIDSETGSAQRVDARTQ